MNATREPEPDTQTESAEPATLRPSNAISVLGRERSARILARLSELHLQAQIADPEPEAGA